ESYRAIQRIVSSALDMTMASGARISLIEDDDRPLRTFFAGPAGVAMAALDRQLLDLTQREGTTVISQLWRVSSALDTSNVQADIRALIALPLRSDHAFHGVLWLAFDREHVVEESEMTFLSTLAQQAAVAVENARLFAEAEEGRRKLEAVLRSTADGMIVVDNAGRVVLINPAAEAYFGVRADQAIGRRASEVIGLPELAQLLTNLQQPASVIELPGQNGQAFQASASTIVSHDGRITGRVAVLRDISALRELDNIKTVFLRLVSHDLRSPLRSEVIDLPELAQLLTNLQQPASVIELPGQNGQAFQASASTIVSHDGRITGRVAVLRDISALRELDNIKTVFLRLVSHDLRSPL